MRDIISMFMLIRLIRRGSSVFFSEQNTILSAAAVIGGVYGLSAFLGFIRNRLLSSYFGDSAELSVYFAADVIPSLIFSLVVSGALSSAFIPVFVKAYKRDKEHAWDVTSSVMNISLMFFLLVAVFVFWQADFVADRLIARESSLLPHDLTKLASLMRIMILAQILLIFSNFYTSILQSFNKFIIPALAPVIYNIGVIIFILLFVKRLGIYAPALGMIFGSILHMGIQYPLVKSLGFKKSNSLNLTDPGVREIYRVVVPRMVGQAAQRMIHPLYTNLALFISAPSNVIFNFANDIQSFPVKVFGMSLAQAALPILSKSIKEDDLEDFKKLFLKTIQQAVFFILPASIGIFILRVPLVRLAVGADKYSWEATVMTAYTLGFFSISLVPQALIMIVARAFYALHDTKTPLVISLFSLGVNAILAVFFVRELGYGVWSIGLAYSIGNVINFTLMFLAFIKKVDGIDFDPFLSAINKILIASFAMGIALYVPIKPIESIVLDTTRTIGLLTLSAIVSLIGFLTYVGFSWILRVNELEVIFDTYTKIKRRFNFTTKAIPED